MPIDFGVNVEGQTVGRHWPMPVFSESHIHEETLTLDTSGAYAAGDTLADLFSVPMPAWPVAILHEVYVLDEDDQGAAFDLLFFLTKPTVSNKNAAWNTTDAEMRSCRGYARITSGDWVDLSVNRVAEVSNLARFIPVPATRLLWVGTVSQGAGTYTANGLRVKLGFMR